jgi:hypothetical protein
VSALEVRCYPFHSDAGHGWLEVPLEECVGHKVSCYSYWGYSSSGSNLYSGRLVAFLEEDVDAVAVVGRQRHLEDGWHRLRYTVEPLEHPGDCFVRGLSRFPAAAADGFEVAQLAGDFWSATTWDKRHAVAALEDKVRHLQVVRGDAS